MKSVAEFDEVALSYDNEFTFSEIGKLQRIEVWDYLKKNILSQKESLTVLELNCGTGEDAIHFASLGHSITATDISSEMIEVVKRKSQDKQLNNNIETKICDLSNFDPSLFSKEYDLVFSNFGGLNCINENKFTELASNLSSILKKDTICIFVIMPKWCLWEIAYFTLKLQFKKAFRRFKKNGAMAKLDQNLVHTWYYNKRKLKKIVKPHFNYIASKPIGITIPPSYLEDFFRNKKGLLRFLYRLERGLNRSSFLSNFSDHLLISFRKK